MTSKLILTIFQIFIISSEILLNVNGFQCPEKFGHYPDSTDCSRYHVCNHGRSTVQTCDVGLLYNSYLKTCDWPRNVMCDKGGKRVNTRRNPDLKKTSYKTHNSEFEETNQLSPDTPDSNPNHNNGYNSRHTEHHNDDSHGSGQYPPSENYRPNRRPNSPQWQTFPSAIQGRGPVPTAQPVAYTPNHRPANVEPLPLQPIENESPHEDDSDYDYDAPDYYDYEPEPAVRNVRKPVKEAEENTEEEQPKTNQLDNKPKSPSVKRIGWLPDDKDSDQLNQYHWSPKDANGYSKYKPTIPEEAYIKMKDFRNVDKELEDDKNPNVGSEEEALGDDDEGPEYEDYYEDDEEPPPEEEGGEHPEHNLEHHPEHHEEEEAAPPGGEAAARNDNRSPNEVHYDDEEDTRQQPRIPPPTLAQPPPRPVFEPASQPQARPPTRPPSRPPTRAHVPTLPPLQYSSPMPAPPQSSHNQLTRPGGQQFTRIKQPVQPDDDISGLRSVANTYESVPNAVSPVQNADHLTKPIIKTNIHYKNINSPYLRPVLDDRPDVRQFNDNQIHSNQNGILINSVPRIDVKPKKRLVIRKIVKQIQPEPKLLDRSSESDKESIYELLDEYRKELPQTLITHKKKAQEFRDSIVNNYMNNEKPNYILNDQDFESGKLLNVPVVSGEGNDNNELYVRDFDKDFQTVNKINEQNYSEDKHRKQSSDRNSVELKQNNNNYNNNNNNNYDYNKNKNKSNVTEQPVSEKTAKYFLNTDAIVKQQRDKDSGSGLTNISPPAEKPKKKNVAKPQKRKPEIPTHYGFKQNVVFIETETTTTTTARPKPVTNTVQKPTAKPKIRIKNTPKPKVVANPTERPTKRTTEWYQNVNYEPKPSNTAYTYAKASKCDPMYCKLPDCRCGGIEIPGGLRPKETPQMILLTFDDSVNDLNWDTYDELFNNGRNNPNGCPILSTFYVSHEWTDYSQVQTLYSKGHEIASHSITHSFGEKFSKELWLKEIAGQREILSLYGGVKPSDVRGMRAPFLQTGGNTMFEMLYEANFTYDSSLPVYEINPPYFPYTLDHAISHECMIPPCPTKSFPGLWEVGMVMWEDLRNGRCSMADACFNPKDEQGVYEMVKKNFDRHYTTNRSPFGIYFHSRWFLTEHNRKGFLKFMDEINGLKDVYFVTNWQMIQWMRDPQPLNKIKSFRPWNCEHSDRPQECSQPNKCKVRLRNEVRVLKTCQPCPKMYPWRGNNGLKLLN